MGLVNPSWAPRLIVIAVELRVLFMYKNEFESFHDW